MNSQNIFQQNKIIFIKFTLKMFEKAHYRTSMISKQKRPE